MMWIRILFSTVAISLLSKVEAANVSDAIHINKGILENIEYNSVHILNFNASEVFDLTPHVPNIKINDQLELTIINHDDVDHSIRIAGEGVEMEVMILAGGSGKANISLTRKAILSVIDVTAKYQYQGLKTMIVVEESDAGKKPYYWNLRELNVLLAKYFDSEYPKAKNDYTAAYFTINNRSFPLVSEDQNVFINATVGDTLTLYIYNSGLMNHNLHFHGYHVKIKYSSDRPQYVGRLKDSMPVDVDQFLVLEIVPQQAGTFPIHNHNLGATVGTNRFGTSAAAICGTEADDPLADNLYPFGMLTQIVISPK